MGELNLNNALDRIRSGVVKERTGGLADLRHILTQNRRTSKLDALSDKAYHRIFECLFRVAKLESSNYARSSRAPAKAQAASRLSTCAGVLRTAVELGVRKVRYKTVKALVDHIIQTLPNTDDGYCAPLVLDYFKILRTILEFQPHPEHFPRDVWHELTDFCLEAVVDLHSSLDDGDSDLSYRPRNSDSFQENESRSVTPSVHVGSSRRSTQHASQRRIHNTAKPSIEDIVLCLRYLHSVPNAPISEKARSTLEALLELLRRSPNVSHTQQAIFDCLNSIMNHMVTDDTNLAQETLKSLIPLICRFWQAKPSALKDSMLISLIIGEPYFGRLMLSDASGEYRVEMQGLLEVFRDEYCKRNDRDRLQIEDLDLSYEFVFSERQSPLSLKAFRPRFGLLKAEQPWALLQISASIAWSLDQHTAVSDDEASKNEPIHVSKRRRINSAREEILGQVRASPLSERQYALQLLGFLLNSTELDKGTLQEFIEALLFCLSDGSETIVTWAMLALSCGADQDMAGTVELGPSWLQAWKLCARQVTSSATCRAASFLMARLLDHGLVDYSEVKDLAEAMLSSVDVNGPVDAVDTTIGFWAVVATFRAKDHLGSAYDGIERVLRWLFMRWSPRTLFDRHHVTQNAQLCSTTCVLHLLSVCLGLSVQNADSHRIPNLGRIAQAYLTSYEVRELVQYLLLDNNFTLISQVDKRSRRAKAIQIPLSSMQRRRVYELIIDNLLIETSIVVRELSSSDMPGTQNTTADMVQVMISLTIINYALLADMDTGSLSKTKDLRKVADQLMAMIINRILFHDNRAELMKGVYECLAAFPPCESYAQESHKLLWAGLTGVAQHFGPDFWHNLESLPTHDGIEAEDAINLEDEFESQGSHHRQTVEDLTTDISHEATAAATNSMAFQVSQTTKLGFLSQRLNSSEAETATAFTEYLISLQPYEFLACRCLINDVFSSDVHFNEKDASDLLKYLGQEILRDYEFERSEVSMGVCLDIMSHFTDIWTSSEPCEVADVHGASLYEWFIKLALDRRISSSHVYVRIASMFREVIKIRPEYARSLSLPSARTSLFKVLDEASLRVKFIIGNDISEIFSLFVLKEHDSIFTDIVDNLPNAVDWLEGLAVRLFVLARLGAAWSTLLRQCIYRLFETPGHIPASAGHAKLCLNFVSQKLRLHHAKELFQLFVPQIMYTWLETQTLTTIPYTIFGYRNIAELLGETQDEIVGQLVMRGKDEEVARLALELRTPYQQLLEASFSKVSAYCMARDIAVPPSQSAHAPGAEARLRKTLGKDQYPSLVAINFANILTVFYKCMEQEELIVRAFQHHPSMRVAHVAYEAMTNVSGPEKAIPANQQPSFKASFLVDQIEHLCNRTSYDVDSMWSPALFVVVFRGLVNTIHPALGSLHACSVLRRLRILICMAGPIALATYPLEMTLHSLRPFLTDQQCSDDTVGIFQYLLSGGLSYLREMPSFLTGIAVSTLISTKAFLGSTQESTTQESEHQATMSKAQSFHTWFANYSNRYSSTQLAGDAERSFQAIVKASRNVQARGNARKGTYESDLLIELFEDECSGRNLLNRPSRDLILGLLCTSFDNPPNVQDDVLDNDEKAQKFANVVWSTCLRVKCGHNFLLWAARVLGRAFAASGSSEFVNVYNKKGDLDHIKDQSLTDSASSSSKSAILRSLSNLLLVDDRGEVGMAEKTLRSIINNAKGTDDFVECEQVLPPSLLESMIWTPYGLVSEKRSELITASLSDSAKFDEQKPASLWLRDLCVALALGAGPDTMLSELPEILTTVEALPGQIFPYILHLAILSESGTNEKARRIVSNAFGEWFREFTVDTMTQIRVLLEALLYIWKQPLPNEATQADRTRWLEIDYKEAARAAVSCSMYKTALMFLEIDISMASKTSRRSSAIKSEQRPELRTELLLSIYEQIDEQDSIYGVQQASTLTALTKRLEYEQAGFKSLSFRGAHYDSCIRRSGESHRRDRESMVNILNTLDLHGLSQSLLSKVTDSSASSIDSMLSTARKLEQWDISVPASHQSEVASVFKVLQGINSAPDRGSLASTLEIGLSDAIDLLIAKKDAGSSISKTLQALAVVAEADEAFSSNSIEQLRDVYSNFQKRTDWMDNDSFENVNDILSCRETIFSSLSKSSKLQTLLKTTLREARSIEIENLLALSRISRDYGALQHALSRMTYLTELVQPCEDAGVRVSELVQFEGARVLWDHGEMSTSINMLEDLVANLDADPHSLSVGKPELFARLGHQVAEARLEKPDEIINRYLVPAIEELHGVSEGDEAGQVYHEFASFCDQQLQNPDGLEDFKRIQRLRERKEAEVYDLERMIKSTASQGKERDNLKTHRAKAKQWFEIDDREYQRLRDSREAFLRQSLENYLLCLKACEKYNNDALRFAALWLENWSSDIANSAVAKYIPQVGSGKFAPLMNQWASRLLENSNTFQKLLSALVTRICIEHPYHGIYQLFAGSKTKGGKDDAANSRHRAATTIVDIVKHHRSTGPLWYTLHNTNINFVKFAQEKLDESKAKPGAKVALRKTTYGQKMEQDVKNSNFPPPTMSIALRPDRNYSDVPTIAKWQPDFSIASGISMPKIATAVTTDGKKYKQLFKSGNDDLRQDAIMEQVFAQVSNLLRAQRSTRQRNLGIRTYKVLPLTATSGIIEFVPNTIPLHEYLIPAHQRHFPKDLKPNNCRKHIADAQAKSAEKRIDVFRKIIKDFHPVLRYFFTERFENPDDWFERRLAYTRSTAAISILGHVLGLGDRHGHNILLDEKTGEVVHIDLGIAFEQGRVLPVPETVPFRLTRDVVDGMGITKTEGVFRRCCEFTLEALRNESYSIMTILDVLRYDPLYSWSLSPLRLKKMQDAQTEAPAMKGEGEDEVGRKGGEEGAGRKGGEMEPGEADRALTVVAKKLSRSLSVVATVNELIQMATDERNLALLFCGWAAYA